MAHAVGWLLKPPRCQPSDSNRKQDGFVTGAFDRLLQRGDIVLEADASCRLSEAMTNAREAMVTLRAADWTALKVEVERVVKDATGRKRLDDGTISAIARVSGQFCSMPRTRQSANSSAETLKASHSGR